MSPITSGPFTTQARPDLTIPAICIDWDQANVETWAYHVINFSAPGVVANDYYV